MRQSRSTTRRLVTAGATGAAVLTLVGMGIAGPASAATTGRDERCGLPLPRQVVGNPGLRAGQASGARVWHDVNGWHVRVTHPGSGTEVFTGTVHSPQPISLRGYRLDREDWIKLSDGGRTLTFQFVNHGALDGVDFHDRCAVNTTFDLSRNGGRLSSADVYLGDGGEHPTGNPFRVQRLR